MQSTHNCADPLSQNDPNFWFELVNEDEGARFVGLSVRRLQGLRSLGGGPPFVRVSGRCVRYRRIDLRRWAESRLRTCTRDIATERGDNAAL